MYRLVKKDLYKASELLARTFFYDPAWCAVVPDEVDRLKRLTPIFQYIMAYGLKYGEIYSPSESIEGISIWITASLGKMSYWRSIRAGCLPYAIKINRKALKIMSEIFKDIDKKREYYTKKEDIYLFILAVDPAFQGQGQGYGSKMLNHMIKKADRENRAIYLETEPDENVRYYSKFGFKVVEEVDMSQYGFKFRYSLRIPQ